MTLRGEGEGREGCDVDLIGLSGKEQSVLDQCSSKYVRTVNNKDAKTSQFSKKTIKAFALPKIGESAPSGKRTDRVLIR